MKATELRSDLQKKIEAMNAHQLKEVYALFLNYYNSKENTEEWAELPDWQKEKISAGILQANTNMTKPLSEVTARLRKKYGLNG